MDENSLFTPFDEITQTRELQMLKTIIPYMPHDSQKQMTLMVHYISLMNSMRMIDCAPALSVQRQKVWQTEGFPCSMP